MKQFLFIISLFAVTVCKGQALIKEIKATDPILKTNKYVFPVITLTGNKIASDRINNFLATDFLDIDKSKIKQSIFENVWATKERAMPVLSDIDYKVLHNDKRILSLSLSAEGCGAYCEYFTTYYCFDLRNGSSIRPDSLLNEQGLQLILDSINKGKRDLIKMKLVAIKDTLDSKAVKNSKEDKEYFKEMQQLYATCLEEEPSTNTDYMKFYIKKNYLYIITGRCSAHFNRNADELGEFKFFFKLSDWKRYFKPYALKLFEL